MSESVTERLQGLRDGFMALTEALRIMLENQRLHGEMLQRILTGKSTIKDAASVASDNITYTLNQ